MIDQGIRRVENDRLTGRQTAFHLDLIEPIGAKRHVA
jgi:hypothetical protein